MAATTLSASSTVSGTGFTTYLASPPAIGGTTAAAGTFTTLGGTTITASVQFSGPGTGLTGTAASLTAGTASAVAASGITGTTLASGVTASSLTSFGASIALGTPASGNLSNCTADGTNKVGYLNLPLNSQTAAYTLVLTDRGKHINITTGGVTVPSAIFSAGDAITIFNNSTASQTITQGASVTMYQAGTANTGNRTLAQRGICTVMCVASNTFVITGGGLT